jgi:hypothetical protein
MFRSRSTILPFALALVSGCGFADPDDAAVTTPPLSNSGAPVVVGMTSSGVGVLDTSGTPMLPVPMTTQGANTAPIIGVPVAPQSTAPPADCGSDSQSANVKPLVLMFTFDVSGSMGEGSTACYDRTLKWEPVVAATKAFFADAGSAGISATLTFFPGPDPNPDNDGQGGMGGNTLDPALCLGDAYTTPSVPLTELPSPAFAAALDAYDPLLSGTAWRIGTPTGPGLEGTIAQIEALKITQPDNKYVIVLVTDGAPALCDNATNDIDNVATILAGAAQDGIPTYVIGVDNPVVADMGGGGMGGMGGTQCEPLANNLQALAEGGGTDTALIIDTGDPLKTSADFKTARIPLLGAYLTKTKSTSRTWTRA